MQRISLKRGSSCFSGLNGAGEGKTFLDSASFNLFTSSSDKSDLFSTKFLIIFVSCLHQPGGGRLVCACFDCPSIKCSNLFFLLSKERASGAAAVGTFGVFERRSVGLGATGGGIFDGF